MREADVRKVLEISDQLDARLSSIIAQSAELDDPFAAEFLKWTLSARYRLLLDQLKQAELDEDYERCIAIDHHLMTELRAHHPVMVSA